MSIQHISNLRHPTFPIIPKFHTRIIVKQKHLQSNYLNENTGPCSEPVPASATFSFGSLETDFIDEKRLLVGAGREVLLLAGNILVLHLPLSKRRPTRLDKELHCTEVSAPEIRIASITLRVGKSRGESTVSSVFSVSRGKSYQ